MANGTVTATGLTIGNTYYLMVDGQAKDDCDYTVNYNGGPLPVTFGEISAFREFDDVVISWETFFESNNSGYYVQRGTPSDELEVGGFFWEEIGFVPGSSWSQERHKYNYVDPMPPSGVAVYRIRQLDFDGFSTYSDNVAIFEAGGLRNELLSVYPNPSNGTFNFAYRVKDNQEARLEIYSISGSLVTSSVLSDGVSGVTSQQISLEGQEAGIYLYRLRIGDDIFNGKITLLK